MIETDLEFPEKWMSFPGDHHVLIAVKTDPHPSPGLGRGERGQSRQRRGLRLFTAESTTHARTFHHHAVHRQR